MHARRGEDEAKVAADEQRQGILAIDADDPRLAPLPGGIGALCAVVQGLLIHDAACGRLYGPPPAGFAVDRTTRPVAERIATALARDPAPLTVPRQPFERQVGTCRDYAAMLCAFARRAGHEARVRCGFAAYLGGKGWQDHWVCEHRPCGGRGWMLADAQMDAEHRAALGIEFEPAHVPGDCFLTADRAWRLWREGAVAAEAFRHGAAGGERFLFVNLARDALARVDALTSGWDRWREMGELSTALDGPARAHGDRLADGTGDPTPLLYPGGPERLIGAWED